MKDEIPEGELDTNMSDVNRLIRRVREYEIDHSPDGWPAVEMGFLSELANALEFYATSRDDESTTEDEEL